MTLSFKKDYGVVETRISLTNADRVAIAILVSDLEKLDCNSDGLIYVPQPMMQNVLTLCKNLAGRMRVESNANVFTLQKEAMTDEELREEEERQKWIKEHEDDMQAPEPTTIPMP
jgi:hypothetical protein